MFVYLFFFLAKLSLCADDDEQDDPFVKPAVISDFINARQMRNVTFSGRKGLAPIICQYFTKPIVDLLQSLQPAVLELRAMHFKSFDGIIVKGQARGIALFPDLTINECNFDEGNIHAIQINGPQIYDEDDESAE